MMSLGMSTEYQQNWELSRETFLMRAMKVSLVSVLAMLNLRGFLSLEGP
jgi:hypothetical protein